MLALTGDVLRSISLDPTLSCINLSIEAGLQIHPVQSNKTKGLFIPKFHTDELILSIGLCRKNGGNTPSDNEEAALSIFCTACLGRHF